VEVTDLADQALLFLRADFVSRRRFDAACEVAHVEKSTQAWPGKISCYFAENEARSPWEPLHVERGYAAESSTVTVVAVRGLYGVTEGVQTTGEGVLETLVASMRYVGSPIYHQMHLGIPVIVVLCPEHAQEIARAGFDRRRVRAYIHEHARLAVREIRDRGYYAREAWKGVSTARIQTRGFRSWRAPSRSGWSSPAVTAATARGCRRGTCAAG
jgi:hypothetical protein